MYQGKHQKKRKSRRWNKSAMLLVSLCLIVGIAIGGTVAFLSTSTSEVKNTFTPSEVTTSVEEKFESGVKSDVMIKNTGDTEAYIRAAVVITWQDAEGNVYGKAPVADTDYTIEYSLETSGDANKWVQGEDGFYYYTSPVKSEKENSENCTTGVLINKVEMTTVANRPEGYSLTVEIIGSGIQSKPASVFNTEWASSGLEVSNDGTLTIKTTNEGGA